MDPAGASDNHHFGFSFLRITQWQLCGQSDQTSIIANGMVIELINLKYYDITLAGMESYEQLKYLVTQLRSSQGEEFRAVDSLMRIAFDEQAMKWHFFQKKKWPPLLNLTNWRNIRKAILHKPILKNFYLSNNRQRLIELLSIQTPDEIIQRQLMFQKQIDALPEIISTKTELDAGTELQLDSKAYRIFIPLASRGNLTAGNLGSCFSPGPKPFNSLNEFINQSYEHYQPNFYVENLKRASYLSEPSNLSTKEHAIVGYRDEVADQTRISLDIRLSQNTFQSVDRISNAWLSEDVENEKNAFLAIDVPSDTHLIQRKLGDGEGDKFIPKKCSEKIIKLVHLHLYDGLESSVRSFSISENTTDIM